MFTPTDQPNLSTLQSASFWFGVAAVGELPRAVARNWDEANEFLAIVREMAVRRGAGQIIFASLSFRGGLSGHAGRAFAFRFYITKAGEIYTEDRRAVRSFGQLVAWAAELRRGHPQVDAAVRETARFIAEFVEIEDGSIVPPPARIPIPWAPIT